ncbi:hypothetical protein ACVW1C_003122 [Bradyrhizobium sp. USDA 4011]
MLRRFTPRNNVDAAGHSQQEGCAGDNTACNALNREPSSSSSLRKQGPITTTANCWPMLERRVPATRSAAAYGSLLSQGRRVGRAADSAAGVATEGFPTCHSASARFLDNRKIQLICPTSQVAVPAGSRRLLCMGLFSIFWQCAPATADDRIRLFLPRSRRHKKAPAHRRGFCLWLRSLADQPAALASRRRAVRMYSV